MKDLMFKIFFAVFIGFLISIGAVMVFAGEVVPQQNTAPTNTVTTEWIIAICTVVATALTAAGIFFNKKRKK